VNYISVKGAAEHWGISERRVQKLCEENRIPGAIRFVRVWAIPKGAEKPADARLKKFSPRDKS
jgi:hypothetical protein